MEFFINDIIIKLIKQSDGSTHDIEHFIKVFSYAKIIGEKEMLIKGQQQILECAAVLHDIACPLCRKKYGCTDGPLQEKEGGILARKFLDEFNLPESFVDEVVWLIENHHTYNNIEKPEHRILLEADYLVNAAENHYSNDKILSAAKTFFRTKTGLAMLHNIYFPEVETP